MRRDGNPQADQLLADARRQIAVLGDAGRMALTYLVEGDWYATPGSSPEALGWDLAPQQAPSPLQPADMSRASALYDQAECLLGGTDLPRLRAALSLRKSLLARFAGDAEARHRHLEAAVVGFDSAGDSAGYHLAMMHRLVADIDDGTLGRHALDLGGGWHRPRHGPVAETVAWAETAGSSSWCVGLGRLLERCGDHWAAQRSTPRSRVAYLSALHLISVDPDLPTRTLITAVAKADSDSNLACNALLRLERAFGPYFEETADQQDEFGFSQKVEASFVLLSALRDESRGPAALLAAERMAHVGRQLAIDADRLRAALPPLGQPVFTTLDDLRSGLREEQDDGSFAAQVARVQADMVRMQLSLLAQAQRSVDTARVLGQLARAEAAQRTGRLAEADRWFARAIEAARGPGVDTYLLPVALIANQRLDEARTAMLACGRQIPDDLQLPLWVRVKDYDQALATLARREADGFVAQDWRDLLCLAELHLARGKPTEARQLVGEAIAVFEDTVRLLLRDPERLEACDQPDVAALYSTLAMTYLSRQGPTAPAEAEASFEAAEFARSLSSDADLGRADQASRTAWQHAAAEYAAAAHQLLAEWPSAVEEQKDFTVLDTLDEALAQAEHAVDAQDRGILLRRAARPRQPTAAQLRHRMPAGTLLLEYLAVGDDLLAWAMTRDMVRPTRESVPLRHLTALVREFHTACAEGYAPATELTSLLLEPFEDLLRVHPRLVVVPFGPLNLVPFHALPCGGTPLALSHIVSYAQSAVSVWEPGGDFDQPFLPARPLVVADPAFDDGAHPGLPRLPGAGLEAQAVKRALRVPAERVLVGTDATEADVLRLLADCDLLHISSHSHLDELSPFASSLVLAGADDLTVADLTGLRFGIRLAVFTGCDTGRGQATLGGDLIGLTRTLLRGGARRCVVSLWPVDDWVVPVLMANFYDGLARQLSPAAALARAQRAVHDMSAEQLQTACTALGGDADTDGSRRRGVVLDPALRDDAELPGGDAERYWASFILME
ncbi:CHAT domain-containing protein [Streptomyces panaciradicis]|uniref:CHAT domain-containing protein n=1 Tax=Streptomyces panaciradicis TaxID=1470261 RepID=UPI00201CCEAB|nr:CHAT domain-containing protein [Streptomyces panaciradicis]MCL6667523.1 CHAT domain-containing protein [Streptomyces panaciradicis]